MRGVVAVGVALLVSLGSSGCFVSDDDPNAQSDVAGALTSSGTGSTKTGATSHSGTGTTGANGAAGSGNGTNGAPTATLTASAVNGTAPLVVDFDLAGTDPDGDNVTWTLEAGADQLGNGTTLPANITHSFTAIGNYTVLLTVRDGMHNATANVTITVSAVVPQEPVELCPTDGDAVEVPGAGLYITLETVTDPINNLGTIWVYEEANGKPGLQRDDDTVPTDCPTPDAIIL